jgi:hypothetical protein
MVKQKVLLTYSLEDFLPVLGIRDILVPDPRIRTSD